MNYWWFLKQNRFFITSFPEAIWLCLVDNKENVNKKNNVKK